MSKNSATATATEERITAGEGRVFSVKTDGGKIETVLRTVAIQDCASDGIFKEAELERSLSGGDVIFSDEYYYSESLERIETLPAIEVEPWPRDEAQTSEAAPEPKPAKEAKAQKTLADIPADKDLVGEIIIHVKKGTVAQFVIGDDGKEYAEISHDSKGENVERKALKRKDWRLANTDEFWENVGKVDQSSVSPNAKSEPEPEVEETSLVKTDQPIEAEVIHGAPLTKKEQTRLGKLEAKYEEADAIERNVPFVKAQILDEIRKDKLYRQTHNTFGEYALARFGITREYAQNLAQIAGIPALLTEVVDEGTEVALSVNTANAIMRDTNKLSKTLGLGRTELEAVAPILRNSLALAVQIAPKDGNGNPELTPRFINEFNKVIADHITDGVVTIDGENMSIQAAHEKGLLSESLRMEVIQGAAEGIKAQSEIIRKDYQNRFQDGNQQQKPQLPNAPDTKYYTGDAPTLKGIVCSKHDETEITSIGTGKLQTRCGCRWLIDSETAELVAFEVDDLPVKRG